MPTLNGTPKFKSFALVAGIFLKAFPVRRKPDVTPAVIASHRKQGPLKARRPRAGTAEIRFL
jgi:hypothetical protein